MLSPAEHIAQARKNEQFVDAIRPLVDHANWGVTGLFYAAVHYGRALVAKSGHVTTHQQFQSIFMRLTNDQVAYAYYRALQTESESSRYDGVAYDWNDVEALRNAHLRPFKEAIVRHGVQV